MAGNKRFQFSIFCADRQPGSPSCTKVSQAAIVFVLFYGLPIYPLLSPQCMEEEKRLGSALKTLQGATVLHEVWRS